MDARIAAGERPDLVVNTRARLDALARERRQGGRGAGSRHGARRRRRAQRFAQARRFHGRRAFAPRSLAAPSVAYTDPAAGGTAGSHFAAVIEKLGLTEALAGKRHLAADGLDVMRKVRSGEVELGITQVSEILLVDRATYAGPLPEALQVLTIYSVFVPATADPVDRAFAKALTGAAGHAQFDAAGFE